MRIEETAARFADVEMMMMMIEVGTGSGQRRDVLSLNTIYNNTGTIGESDGDIQISERRARADRRLRPAPARTVAATFPRHDVWVPARRYRQPDFNFGAPAPINVQVRGNDLGADFAYANKLLAQIRHVTGIADARIQQSAGEPTLDVNIDRTRAQYTGVTAADVTTIARSSTWRAPARLRPSTG